MMKHPEKKLLSLLVCLALLYALSACGASGGTPASEEETPSEATEPVENDAAEVTEEEAETYTLQLGTSAFSMTVPAHFTEGEMTAEDIADDQVGYYKSDATLLDFDVYQFSKEGLPEALADYVAEEAADYSGTDIVTDADINGITVGSYRSVEESEGTDYNVITYVFEDSGEYVEVVFWLDGADAEAEADAIISTLTLQA